MHKPSRVACATRARSPLFLCPLIYMHTYAHTLSLSLSLTHTHMACAIRARSPLTLCPLALAPSSWAGKDACVCVSAGCLLDACACVPRCSHPRFAPTLARTHARTHTHARAHMHTCTSTHAHMLEHTCTHARAHMHTHDLGARATRETWERDVMMHMHGTDGTRQVNVSWRSFAVDGGDVEGIGQCCLASVRAVVQGQDDSGTQHGSSAWWESSGAQAHPESRAAHAHPPSSLSPQVLSWCFPRLHYRLLTLCPGAGSGPQGLYTAYIQPIYGLYTAYIQPIYSPAR